MDWSEIGKSDKPCQNPPELSDEDRLIWEWYERNMTEFNVSFNLVPALIEGTGFKGMSLEIFLAKLNMIWKTMSRIKEKEEREKEDVTIKD